MENKKPIPWWESTLHSAIAWIMIAAGVFIYFKLGWIATAVYYGTCLVVSLAITFVDKIKSKKKY